MNKKMLTTEMIKEYKEERNSARINFKIKERKRKELKDLAKRKDISMSALIRMLIYECLEEDKNQNE